MANKKPLILALLVLLGASVVVYLVGGWINQKWEKNNARYLGVSQIVEGYHNVQVGNLIKEVEETMGTAPHTIDSEVGFLKTPNTLLVGQAAEGKGELKSYKLHRWSFDECHAVVVFDSDGTTVVGKWIWGADYVRRTKLGVAH